MLLTMQITERGVDEIGSIKIGVRACAYVEKMVY